MIKKIFMVATVIVLVFLIIITPTFISQQQSIGAVPFVFIDHLNYTVLIDVHSVVVEQRYWNVSMCIRSLDNPNYTHLYLVENNTYDIHTVVNKNDTRRFTLNVTIFDQNLNGYDYNATIEIKKENDKDVMSVRKSGSDQGVSVDIGKTFRYALTMRRGS